METEHESAGLQVGAEHDGRVGGAQKRKWLVIGGIVLLVLVGIVAWRLSSLTHGAQRARMAGMPQPVGTATIGTRDIRVLLNQLGTVAPLATVTVQPQLSGQLMEIGFKEGQIVHKGDFLAQIDPRPYQVALSQYQAQLLRDQAALRQAQTDLERYHALQERDSIAKQTVDDQEWQVKQVEGTVRLDQAQVEAQKLNLTYCHITSPITGRVGLRQVDVGNYIQVNSSTGLVVVTQLDPMSVVFTVPEDAVPAVHEHFHRGGELPVTVADRSNAHQLAAGRLDSIDTQVDISTGTVKMRALFDNKDGALYPQQFVNVQLLVDTLRGVVAAPTAAVQYGANGPFVYLLAADDTVSVHPIKLGAQDGDWIAVQSGLSAGDRVVTDGLDQLKDGAHVTLRDATAAGPGAPTDHGKWGAGRGKKSADGASGWRKGDRQPGAAGRQDRP